jgi:mono/diheme cytochrome c family protein
MLPFGHLPQEDRQALIKVVKTFVHDGVVDRVKKEAAEFNEEVKPEELATALKNRMDPGARIVVPADLPKEDRDSLARGRELYVKSCATCHGDTGKGDGVQEQKDEFGVPIRPRDFTRGIFKGGRDRDQLYARITLGVPGTPMPASPQLKPAEAGDIINYILSLSEPTTAEKVEHKRTRIVARKLSSPLGETAPDSVWTSASVPVVVSPLWWRDSPGADLQVEAIHDGQNLAVRLTWRDATRNEAAVRPQDFPDMAAVQWFAGERAAEPFLGMGAHDGNVDLWLWNAAAQADRTSYGDVDSTYPHMSVDLYPLEKAGDAARPHATDRQPKEFLAAWAAGNQRSDPTRGLPGSNLHARGPGSTTLRPKTSQVVVSKGQWHDGVWSVVLRRPLLVESDAGIPLEPGQPRSIAFALWDGAVQDRNGQKQVSIWHDIELE